MVPKTGKDVPNRPSEPAFAQAIGQALRADLGASRRATKSVMRWAGVSDRTARSWLQGSHAPCGRHLVTLSANSRSVMELFLLMTGRDSCLLSIDLEALEQELQRAINRVRELRSAR